MQLVQLLSTTKMLLAFMFLDLAVSATLKNVVFGGSRLTTISLWLAVVAMICLALAEVTGSKKVFSATKDTGFTACTAVTALAFEYVSISKHFANAQATQTEKLIMLFSDAVLVVVTIFWVSIKAKERLARHNDH